MYNVYKEYWKKSFDIKGTSNVKQFILPLLINFLIQISFVGLAIIGTGILMAVVHGVSDRLINGIFLFVVGLFYLFNIASIPATITVTIRRLHDLSLSTKWFAIMFLPILISFIGMFFNGNGTIINIINIISIIVSILETTLLLTPRDVFKKIINK